MNHRISRDGIEGVDDINYFLTLLMSFTVGSLVSLLIFTRFIHWVIPMFGSLTIMLCLDLNKRKRQEIYSAPHGKVQLKRYFCLQVK